MQLIGVQFDIAWEDWRANYLKVTQLLEKSPPQRGSLMVLPEMFSSGFSMNLDKFAADEAGSGEAFLCGTAVRFDVCLIGGIATRGADGVGQNEAIVATPLRGVIARYRKIHPFGKEAQRY